MDRSPPISGPQRHDGDQSAPVRLRGDRHGPWWSPPARRRDRRDPGTAQRDQPDPADPPHGRWRVGRVTSETQPVTDTASISTSFGYDAAGLRTRFTDGRGNPFLTTYNTWNLPESQIEPATAATPDTADRTFTATYDADGRVASNHAPGDVVVTNTYDEVGNLTHEEGTGADAPTASRSFGYDLAGRLTSTSAPGGTDTFGYDDRGLLLSANGPSGGSSFAYDNEGRMTSRTDAAGSATYGYDNYSRLNWMTDPSTGTDLSITYNPVSQVSRIAYGTNGNTRSFGYDPAHRLASDTLAGPSGDPIASIGYGHDAAGDLTSKTTTGLAGATSNTYGYDYAGRLTSWDNGTTIVGFGYDASGNRTSAAGATFTYDARNELLTGNGNTYHYTARGTLASVSGGSGTVTSTSDAFGQTISEASRSYSYDALGRLVPTATSGTADRTLGYTGQGNDVASDGSFTYSRGPDGRLVGEKGTGDGVLAWTDQHTDVVGQFTANGGTSGSESYDPFGTVLVSASMLGNLGYQSGWTDPATSKVNMLARWYDPAAGQFTSRDSVGLDPVPASVTANRFAYVNDSPLTDVDPTGHCAWYAVSCEVKAAGNAIVHKVDQAWDWGVNKVEQAWDWGVSKAKDALNWGISELAQAWNWADRQVQHAYDEGKKITNKVVNTAKHAASTVVSTVHDAAHQVALQAHEVAGKVSHAVTKIADEAVDLADKAGKWIEEHKQQIAAGIAGLVVGVGVFAGCMALSFGVGSVGCAAIAGAAGGAVAGAIGCPAGMSKVKCAGIGAAGGLVAGAVGAVAVGAIAAGAAALGAGSTLAGIVGGTLGGALAGAAGDVTSQLIGTGKVNWSSVATSAAVGGVLGGVFGGIGGARATGCHSFDPDTKVQMADGSAEVIKNIKLGDKVAATNPDTGKTTAETVVALHDNHDTDLADVTVTVDHRTAILHTTQHHLFWDATAGSWVAAADLVVGHRLRTADGSVETVAAVHSYTAAKDMRDLTVNHVHTYYVVAGNTPVLVHNCNTIDPSEVKFSQKGVSQNFKDGRSVTDLADSLRNGTTDPMSVEPIRLVQREDGLFTLDNRRLVAYQMAEKPVPYRMATAREARRESWKFDTEVGGLGINVRGWGWWGGGQ